MSKSPFFNFNKSILPQTKNQSYNKNNYINNKKKRKNKWSHIKKKFEKREDIPLLHQNEK